MRSKKLIPFCVGFTGDVDCEEDERTIFVSNLRYDCTREDMIRIFEICGPIEDVKYANPPCASSIRDCYTL
jgi:RNA recognition motif-containing protein